MINTDDVRSAYRLILGREPENEQVLIDHAHHASSFEDLRRAFFCSPEFRNTEWVLPPAKPLDWPPIEVEVDASDLQLSLMMSHIEANWRHLGLSDPHWSVMADDAFRVPNLKHTKYQFYESGKHDVERLRRTAERCAVDLSKLTHCFEFGCGVGRMTIWLAGFFERVIAADISPIHLVLAREASDRVERANVDFVHVGSLGALESLPPFDVFVSFIMLQHNPPPLIAALLTTVLNKLQPGGIAYFQVPTYLLDYGFRVEEYLRSASSIDGMEMHLLPQYALFDILQNNGCRLLECREDHLGNRGMISNCILARKQLDAA